MSRNNQRIADNSAVLRQSAKRRLAILKRAQAVWSKRKTDPIKELAQLRRRG